MKRRDYLKVVGGTGAVAGLAGCIGGGDGGDGGDGGSDGGDGGDGGEGTPEPEKEVITIGSDIPYRPFEYEDEDGNLTGFDVDIAEAIFAGELGLEYRFQQTAFDGIIAALNNGNFRIIMSAMTITDQRAEQVDFSDPYFTAYQTIVVLENSDIESKEALKGKTVGVQKGTTGEAAATALKEEFDGDLTIRSFDQIQGAFQGLQNNQVVAVINDNTVNAEFVAQTDGVRFVEGAGAAEEAGQEAPPYLTLTVENYGIAFRQNDDEFREEVNGAIAAIKDSGTYDEIYSSYFAG